MNDTFTPIDTDDRRIVAGAQGALAAWNQAGVLEAADVHVARRVCSLAGESDETVALAVALVVRATRRGSVCLDLAEPLEAPEGAPPLPEAAALTASVAGSGVVRTGVVRLDGTRLYLDRYWREEGEVVTDLVQRVTALPRAVDVAALDVAVAALFPQGYEEQGKAARACALAGTSVLTGGPGTGKTATVARLLAVLNRLAGRPLRVALAAPTGKAAARMTQAVAEEIVRDNFPASDRASLDGLEATTLHRLLGSRPDNGTRFKRHRGNRLTHEVVVVDESSMVSLTMMARLLEALRPDTVLVLVGDAQQLASVEAGAVLDNLVDGLRDAAAGVVPQLAQGHRFGEHTGIGKVARAVNAGEGESAWQVLEAAKPNDVRVVELGSPVVAAELTKHAVHLSTVAAAGDAVATLEALRGHRLLCAHREGPFGVGHWNEQIERWLMVEQGLDYLPRWYVGQPLLVNVNDYSQRLWNGDTGVVVPDEHRLGQLQALFDDGTPQGRRVPISRLPDTQTAHAMTVHRAQGSQFGAVTLMLPDEASALLTRELVYTALTRAQEEVLVVGTQATFIDAVARRAARATGLRERLVHSLGSSG